MAEVDAARDRGVSVMLHDFANYNMYSSERVPDQESSELTHWFADPSHGSPELGTVVDAIVHLNAEPVGAFGVELTGANIDAHLMEQLAAREQYAAEQPGSVERIAYYHRATRPKRAFQHLYKMQ